MQLTITISDADREVDYLLEVTCDFLTGLAPRWGWRDGGDAGEAPAVEVSRVRCQEIAVWCGPYAVSAWPAGDCRRSLEQQIGQWCLEKYSEEIELAALENCLAQRNGASDRE
jgi:hypothetical protein